MRGTRLAVALVALLLGSCGSRPEAAILGKWQGANGGALEFHPGGTVTMTGQAGEAELKYRFPEERTLELTRLDGAGRGIQMRVESVSADELVLTGPKGKERFKRVK